MAATENPEEERSTQNKARAQQYDINKIKQKYKTSQNLHDTALGGSNSQPQPARLSISVITKIKISSLLFFF